MEAGKVSTKRKRPYLRKLDPNFHVRNDQNKKIRTATINSCFNVVAQSQPSLGWVKIAFGLPKDPNYPLTLGTPLTQAIFLLCRFLNDHRRAAHSFFKISCLSSLSSPACLHLLILLLLLMSHNVHPNPGPIFPCLVSAGNVTWRCRSVQCSTCSKWVHLKCSLLSSLIQISWQLLLLELPPASFGDNTVTSSSDSSSLYTSTVQSAPPPPLYKCSTPAPPSPLNLLSPFCPLPIFSLCTLTTASCSWLSLYTSCFFFTPDSIRVLQLNAGGLQTRSTEPQHFFLSHSVGLICILNLTFIHLPFSRSLDSLFCDLITLTPDLAFSLQMPHTLAAASLFSSGKAHFSQNFLPPLFLHLTHTLIM